ncbi:MAG TPA: sugar phosphate nucleotidyltransferase [Candidatus Elarobacter sp.]|nr:sugar phosphate nucleotidyltransferase [Candidatus Elarobacter sp.]
MDHACSDGSVRRRDSPIARIRSTAVRSSSRSDVPPTSPRRAIIPCGGRGTRMAALTRGTPKELLPVGGVPVLQRVLGECAASGVSEVLIVTAPGKEAIERFAAPFAGMRGMPARIEFVTQHDARGLADAIRHGRAFADGEATAVALPDNLFVGAAPAIAQVGALFAATGMNVVGIAEVFARDAALCGPSAVYPGRREGDLFRIERIPDKGSRGSTFDTGGAPSALTGVGRYVFTTDAFDVIDEVEHGLAPGAELDDIPLMRTLLARGKLVGCVLHGRFLDVGLAAGYRDADEVLAAEA